MISFRAFFTALLAVGMFAFAENAPAASLPSNFAETQIDLGSLELDPTSMSFAPDGRLFVCEKDGVIRVIKNGTLLAEPFLEITDSVQNYNEQGLQSLAFDPNFAENGYVYIYYTARTGSPFVGFNRVSRFTAIGDIADPASEVVLLEISYPGSDSPEHTSALHNGGALHFRDGFLYIAVGDDQNGENAQNLGNRFGKILRINPDPDNLVPADNPFVGNPNADPLIWAYGLRNPFTFAFHPVTGTMFINDVGAALWEEINQGQAGKNYGWPRTEGETTNPDFTGPIYAYPHRARQDTPPPHSFFDYPHTQGCAITGGAFYNPATAPFPEEYVGRYFFADYCNGQISTIDPENPMDVRVFATNVDRCVDIDVAPDGSLYYIARGGEGSGSDADNTSSDEGRIFRVVYTGSQAPTIASHPEDVTTPIGEDATFSIVASGSDPVYQWMRNGEEIEGAQSAVLTYGPVTTADNGSTFTCVVTNAFGSATSDPATLSVTDNTRPVATILTPTADFLYEGGTVLDISGSGTDAEDGTLPASAFTWKIDFHHDTHFHPGLPETSGMKELTHTIEASGHETSANVWYRIYLTVTDSEGLSHTVYREVHPRVIDLTLATEPAGLTVRLDGSPHTTPYTVEAVAGMVRDLSVEDPQILDGIGYRFVGWSDEGSLDHAITTPGTDTTYTASFIAAPDTVGIGLKGEYFSDQALTFNGPPTLVREGEAIDFEWGEGSPDPAISADVFTARWTGQVQPQFTESYTFHADTDDGVRLWVNDQLVIDEWEPQAAVHSSDPIALEAGRLYAIRMEYFESGGDARAKLSWSSPSQAEQLIPRYHLFPDPVAVNLEVATATTAEGESTSAAWRFVRNGSTDQPLTVNFSLNGSASLADDYTLSSGPDSVTIPAGERSVMVNLTAAKDSLAEGVETAMILLDPASGYAIGNASGTIEINDSPIDVWRIARFGGVDEANRPEADDLRDWDGDGVTNLFEYGLDTDPTSADAESAWPRMDYQQIGGVEYLTLTFTRKSPPPADISYIVESNGGVSTSGWSPAVILPGFPSDNGDGTETITARDSQPVTEDGPRLMRLRITRP